MILAMDSSTAIASLALYDGAVSAEITWRSGRNHSVELMDQAMSLMRLRRVAPGQLRAIAVAVGPGSYTGLRVGLSCAKGLCLALGLPLVGVCTLDILAEAQSESCLPVRPLLDAGRRRFATALYRKQNGRLSRETPIEGLQLPEVLARVSEPTLLCGDIYEDMVADFGGGLIEIAGPAASLRRAGYLAEIAWSLYNEGRAQDPGQVDAVYLSREGE